MSMIKSFAFCDHLTIFIRLYLSQRGRHVKQLLCPATSQNQNPSHKKAELVKNELSGGHSVKATIRKKKYLKPRKSISWVFDVISMCFQKPFFPLPLFVQLSYCIPCCSLVTTIFSIRLKLRYNKSFNVDLKMNKNPTIIIFRSYHNASIRMLIELVMLFNQIKGEGRLSIHSPVCKLKIEVDLLYN